MLDIMDEFTIIQLKLKGWSNRKIERECGYDRKTVARYWNGYLEKKKMIEECRSPERSRLLQEELLEPLPYNTSSRQKRKYNAEIDSLLDKILDDEEHKNDMLGPGHKQRLTNTQILGLVREEGHDIGLTTISTMVKLKRDSMKEAYIKQEYDYGERFEYDFGEARIFIAGQKIKVHMAVFACPASGFRWGYLYRNQKMDVFIDSHSRFFEMMGGTFKEGVYDNMKNVVSRFIGRNEKELNKELINLSKYYGYIVNVTNCFRGNEKGTVESAVKWVRNRTFSLKYRFDSFDEAEQYMQSVLVRHNRRSRIEEEKKHLGSYRSPYEIVKIHSCVVDKYSFVHVGTNSYSVDDAMVGKTVVIKEFPNEIAGFYEGLEICRHKKPLGKNKTCIDILHYLRTLQMKPGALRNSAALRSIPELKDIFNNHFKANPKEFIALLAEYKEHPVDDIPELMRQAVLPDEKRMSEAQNHVEDKVDEELRKLGQMFIGGGGNVH